MASLTRSKVSGRGSPRSRARRHRWMKSSTMGVRAACARRQGCARSRRRTAASIAVLGGGRCFPFQCVPLCASYAWAGVERGAAALLRYGGGGTLRGWDGTVADRRGLRPRGEGRRVGRQGRAIRRPCLHCRTNVLFWRRADVMKAALFSVIPAPHPSRKKNLLWGIPPRPQPSGRPALRGVRRGGAWGCGAPCVEVPASAGTTERRGTFSCLSQRAIAWVL